MIISKIDYYKLQCFLQGYRNINYDLGQKIFFEYYKNITIWKFSKSIDNKHRDSINLEESLWYRMWILFVFYWLSHLKNIQVFNCFLNLSFLKLHVDTKNEVSIINVTKILYISVYTVLCLDEQRHQRK